MPSMKNLSGTPRRELHVFYILDTSGSMSGVPIATVNTTMTETLAELKDQAKHNADALVKLAVLEFSSGCRWLTNEKAPEELGDFVWQKLTAGGLTDMGVALKELNSKLSRHAFLSSMTGAYVPVLIFMTDGYATDNYKDALEQIRQNRWFKNATKIGFAIGENPDKAMIAEIVGTSEAVIATDDLGLFAKMLKFVSITATMLASQSQTTTDMNSGKDIVDMAIKEEDASNKIFDVPKPQNRESSNDDDDDGDGGFTWEWGDDFD